MEIIPEEVRNRARQLDNEFWNQNAPQGSEELVMDFIIRAILEERERCAKIAESMFTDYYGDPSGDIAEAIRSGA